MKKSLALFLLSIILFAQTNLRELTKIPLLFEHFNQHNLDGKEMNFVEFLCIHYLHEPIHDDDYSQDIQLPFKTLEVQNTFPAIVLMPIIVYKFQIFCPINIIEKNFLENINTIFSHYSNKIWEPPQFA